MRDGASPANSNASVLQLMRQLEECQEALRRAESRCEVLLAENVKLRSLNTVVAEVPAYAPVETDRIASSIAVSATHVNFGATIRSVHDKELEARDQLIAELQRQLTDTIRRNTSLEREMQSQHTSLRQKFETHVERLELELRKWKAQSRGLPSSSRAVLTTGAVPYVGGVGPTSTHSPSTSTRRDLL